MCLERAICWMHRLVGWEVRTRGARFLFCFVGEGESRGIDQMQSRSLLRVVKGKLVFRKKEDIPETPVQKVSSSDQTRRRWKGWESGTESLQKAGRRVI